PTVVHEQVRPRLDVAGQSGVADRYLALVPRPGLPGDGELLADRERHRPGREPAQPDLGTLQVDQHAHAPAAHVAGRADGLVGGTMRLVVTVAHVEPGHIETRRHQLRDRPGTGGGG